MLKDLMESTSALFTVTAYCNEGKWKSAYKGYEMLVLLYHYFDINHMAIKNISSINDDS